MREQRRDTRAFAETQTKLAIAAPLPVARRHEIAETTQAVKGFGPRAERLADSHHLGERTCEQRGSRVVPQFQSIAAPRRDRVDILQAPAKFNTGQIATGVNPQRRSADRRLHLGQAFRRPRRRQHHRCRQAPRHLARVGRPGERSRHSSGQHLGDHLRGPEVRLDFNALRQTHDHLQPRIDRQRHPDPRTGFPQCLGRARQQNHVSIHQCSRKVGRHPHG